MSGVGGYVADIDEWGTNSTAAYFERNSIKITATFKENVSLGLLYHNIKLRQSCVLKVTGIPEGCDAFLDDRLGNISEGFLVLFGNEVGFFLPFLQNAFASYQLVCISQTVCSIYVVELKHDSIRNSIHAASYRDTLFSLNDRCCICMKSFFLITFTA